MRAMRKHSQPILYPIRVRNIFYGRFLINANHKPNKRLGINY